jgi:hypothetical protein
MKVATGQLTCFSIPALARQPYFLSFCYQEAAAVEHVDQIAKEAETQLQEDWSRKESTIVGGAMEGQQIEAGVNPAEQIQADLSLKESVEDSQCYTKSSQVPVNSSDKVVTPSP